MRNSVGKITKIVGNGEIFLQKKSMSNTIIMVKNAYSSTFSLTSSIFVAVFFRILNS